MQVCLDSSYSPRQSISGVYSEVKQGIAMNHEMNSKTRTTVHHLFVVISFYLAVVDKYIFFYSFDDKRLSI